MWWIWIIVAGVVAQAVILVVMGRRLWHKGATLSNDLLAVGAHADVGLSLMERVGDVAAPDEPPSAARVDEMREVRLDLHRDDAKGA